MKKLLVVVTAIVASVVTGCAHKPQSTQTTLALQLPTPVSGSCHSVDGLPDSNCTPGVVRTTDVNEICHGGSTKQFRPTVSYTDALKQQGIGAYGYANTNMQDYEEDHLISLELGGDGKDPKNLWPEPHLGTNNSFDKDKVENWLHKQICSGAMTPEQAQQGIATDWRQYLPNVSGVSSKKAEVQ